MNSLIEHHFPILEQTLALRQELHQSLDDADLLFALPGNLTLGELCRQQGEIDVSYIDVFKTFKQNWTYTHPKHTVESDLNSLQGWITQLEAEFKAVVSQLSEEQISSQIVNRGNRLDFSIGIVFHIYRESLLIFLAKASLYLKALDKPLSQQWRGWIG